MRSCPRPDVDCVYTPALDNFLPDLVPKCKSEDKVLRKTQDLLLDVTGPIAMSYEMVWQAKENSQSLDLSTLLSCLTRSLQLLGNVNNHVSAKRRAQVLSIIGQKYASLSNESWETNGKELFDQQFEQRLKQRSRTAKAISTATFVQRGKPFFFKRHPLSETLEPGGVQPVTGALISEARPIVLPGHSGKVKNNSTLHPVNPSEPVRNPPAHSGMPVKLSVIPSVSKLPLGGRIALFLSELAEHNKRPLGLGNCGGVQDRVSGIPPPDLHSQHACIRGGERFYRSRSAFSPSKTCHPQGSKTQWSRPEPVHKPLIHCSHKRGWAQASNKPQRLKPVCRVPAFQNGRCTNVKRSFKTKRLFNQDRPKGCLPYCFNMDPSPKIPAIHLEGHYVGVRMSSLWASQCSPHVLKVTKISCSPVKKNGNQTNYLPRRHAYHGRVQRLSHRTHHHCSCYPASVLC